MDLGFFLTMCDEEKLLCENQKLYIRSEFSFIEFLFEFAAKWNILTLDNARWYLARSRASSTATAAIEHRYGIPLDFNQP